MSDYKRSYNFWEDIDSFVGSDERYSFGDRTFSYWPSEAAAYKEIPNYGTILIGKGCKRAIWYRYNKVAVTNPMQPDGWYKAMMGKVCESFIFNAAQKKLRLVANNVKFYNTKYNISGEVDAIMKEPSGDLFILELKTIDGWFATKNIVGHRDISKHWVPGHPKDEHLLQALLYDILNNDPAIKYVKLAYLARDTVTRAEFDITHTKIHGTTYPVVDGVTRFDIDVNKMLERYELYNLVISQDTPPERDYALQYEAGEIEKRYKAGLIFKTAYEKYKNGDDIPGDWTCSYCNYKSHCYRIGGK